MTYVPAPGYQSLYNPPFPLTHEICGGLRSGTSVHIQGTASCNSERFAVNFACGQFEGPDIALHFNPRFDQGTVVFNTFQCGSWGSEEVKCDGFPFHRGGQFELSFFVKPEGYQVNVNGCCFYVYRHRMPLERVQYIHVGGDLTSLQSFAITRDGGCTEGVPISDNKLPVMGCPIINPVVPYCGTIPGGLSPKRTVVVRGSVPWGAERFHIDFMVSSSNDIALHFNPRFNLLSVVRNSHLNGCWGPEELFLLLNPFFPGLSFDISIRCGCDRFKIYVNGLHFCDYAHRFKELHRIDQLVIGGNVVLSLVQV